MRVEKSILLLRVRSSTQTDRQASFINQQTAQSNPTIMLAGWIELAVPSPGPSGFGMILDSSNNSISSLADDGIAMKSGMQVGDLIVSIDGTTITEFDGQPGPVGGTVLCTSEPQSMAAAAEAIAPNVPTHAFRLLRLIDPSSIPESPLNSPSYQSQDEAVAPPRQPPPQPQHIPQQAPQVYVHPDRPMSQDPLAHYPWATEIVLPDHSFGASGGRGDSAIKLKYNIAPGSALPPLPQVVPSHETEMRKTMFSGRSTGQPAIFMNSKR